MLQKKKAITESGAQLLTKFSVGEGRWGAKADSQCREEDGTPDWIHTAPAYTPIHRSPPLKQHVV